jgi:hypothetical protein
MFFSSIVAAKHNRLDLRLLYNFEIRQLWSPKANPMRLTLCKVLVKRAVFAQKIREKNTLKNTI